MQKLYLIAALAACLGSGCHTANPLPAPTSAPPAGIALQENECELSPELEATRRQLRRLPVVIPQGEIQLASFQQAPSSAGSEEPTAQVPGMLAPAEGIATPSPAEPIPAALTLAELEGLALGNNPALAQAAAMVTAAHGNWLQVGLPPNPVVGYSGAQLGSGGKAEQNGVLVGQEFVTGHKLQLNRERALWEVQQRKREFEQLRLQVLTDTRIAYYEVLIAQRREAMAANLLQVGQRAEEVAGVLFEAGEVSKADPLRASIEADTARILLRTARNQHAEAWRRLTAVVGMPTLVQQPLAGELEPELIELTWHEALERVLTESPEIAGAMAQVQSARWALQRAQAEVIPNVEVEAVIQDDRGTDGTNANLQVTLPLPLWNRNQGGIQQAYGQAVAAQRAVDRKTLELQSRLAMAFQRYESARDRVELYVREDGILAKAERTVELLRSGYRADEFSVLDLLTAQRTYFETNLAYLEALRELWTAAMEMRGLLLSGSLSQ